MAESRQRTATFFLPIGEVSAEPQKPRMMTSNIAAQRSRRYDTDEEFPMIELTERQCVELGGPEPSAIDPQTRETYILVRRETYERFKALLALDDYDPEEGAGFVNDVMAADDAKDPLLESYQHFGKTA